MNTHLRWSRVVALSCLRRATVSEMASKKTRIVDFASVKCGKLARATSRAGHRRKTRVGGSVQGTACEQRPAKHAVAARVSGLSVMAFGARQSTLSSRSALSLAEIQGRGRRGSDLPKWRGGGALPASSQLPFCIAVLLGQRIWCRQRCRRDLAAGCTKSFRELPTGARLGADQTRSRRHLHLQLRA